MKKSKIFLFGIVAVIALVAVLVLSGAFNSKTSSNNDELTITKGEKSELAALKCGDGGEDKKCDNEGEEKKCGKEGEEKKECDKKKEEKKCDEGKCGDEKCGEADESEKQETTEEGGEEDTTEEADE